MKRILGLDLGTNSIGWALIEQDFKDKSGKILGMGSRIIPMTQDRKDEFGKGNSISQTADRTGFRGTRRLRERFLLRRERLHRVLNVLGFLPEHYANQIDFEKRLGKFLNEKEPKINYKEIWNPEKKKNEFDFIFKDSFEEMLTDFRKYQPQLLENNKKLPYDWTIYYLRKKALSQKITKEELAWILLNFNQKRGYYQLRGEEEEENPNKLIEFYSLKIIDSAISRARQKALWSNLPYNGCKRFLLRIHPSQNSIIRLRFLKLVMKEVGLSSMLTKAKSRGKFPPELSLAIGSKAIFRHL